MSNTYKQVAEIRQQALEQRRGNDVAAERRREVDRWRPSASIDVNCDARMNELVLSGSREFSLFEATLHNEQGVMVASIFHPSLPALKSHGARVLIPEGALVKLVSQDAMFGICGRAQGRICYVLDIDGQERHFEWAFRAIQDLSGSKDWIRLEG